MIMRTSSFLESGNQFTVSQTYHSLAVVALTKATAHSLAVKFYLNSAVRTVASITAVEVAASPLTLKVVGADGTVVKSYDTASSSGVTNRFTFTIPINDMNRNVYRYFFVGTTTGTVYGVGILEVI